MALVQTILHPTDFSPHSERAFAVASSLARDYGARLVVLHIAEPPVVVYDGTGTFAPLSVDYRAAAREALDRVQAADAAIRLERRLAEGEVSGAILRAAAEVHADLIVMGTQGRTGIGRLLIGSVAEDVLRRAACPVLTVKATAPGPAVDEPEVR